MNGRQLLSSSFGESRRPSLPPVEILRLGLGEQPGNTRCHGHGSTFFACSLLIGPFLVQTKWRIWIYWNKSFASADAWWKNYRSIFLRIISLTWEKMPTSGKGVCCRVLLAVSIVLLLTIFFVTLHCRSFASHPHLVTEWRRAPAVEQPKRFYRINMTNPTRILIGKGNF